MVELKSGLSENVQDGLSGDEESVFSVFFFFSGGFQAGGASRRWKTTHGFPLGEWSADGVVILVVWIAK